MHSIGGGQIFKGTFMGAEVAAKKVFSTGRTADPNRDMEREVTMLAQLVHPNILYLIGVCEVPSTGDSIIVRITVLVINEHRHANRL